jgi:hypothetical protein
MAELGQLLEDLVLLIRMGTHAVEEPRESRACGVTAGEEEVDHGVLHLIKMKGCKAVFAIGAREQSQHEIG